MDRFDLRIRQFEIQKANVDSTIARNRAGMENNERQRAILVQQHELGLAQIDLEKENITKVITDLDNEKKKLDEQIAQVRKEQEDAKAKAEAEKK